MYTVGGKLLKQLPAASGNKVDAIGEPIKFADSETKTMKDTKVHRAEGNFRVSW